MTISIEDYYTTVRYDAHSQVCCNLAPGKALDTQGGNFVGVHGPTVGAPSAFREPVPQPGPSAHARGSAPARTRAMAKMPNTRRAPLPIVPATVLMALGFNRTSLERANSGGKGSTRG